MAQSDPSTNSTVSPPASSLPPLYNLFGFGLYLYGDRDFDEDSGRFTRTLCFCLFYIPVIALRSYRVEPAVEDWSYLGRVPVSRPARIGSVIAAILIPSTIASLVAIAQWNSPAGVASRELDRADRLVAEGHVGEAAGVLSHVAMGQTDRAGDADQRLAALLAGPASRADPEGRGKAFRAAVELQRAGRWKDSAKSLHDSGVALARETAGQDPRGAWAILDAVTPLSAPEQSESDLRHELLEKVVAAEPADVDWASRLAGELALRGELDRAEKLLAPLRDRLGNGEGARVLGLCDARAARFHQAIPLLRAYTKDRLKRLADAETRLQGLYRAFQTRIMDQLKNRQVFDFDFARYNRGGQGERQEQLQEYLVRKIKGDPEVERAQATVVLESSVMPAALDLGMALLQVAQTQADPASRKASLDEAEALFLGISRMSGDQVENKLSLAQVYYWQGKQAQGRMLFNEVLDANKRPPVLLLEVSNMLNHLGSRSESRALAEECYNTVPDGPIKLSCAVTLAIMADEIDNRILWLRRADQDNPGVRALLLSSQAEQAITRGDDSQAIASLRQAVALYGGMTQSTGTLNNHSLALSRLAELTGDPAAFAEAGALMEKSAALDPSNSLAMANAAHSLVEAGLHELIGPAIDLRLIKISADISLLGFLSKDEADRQAIASRLGTQAAMNRALGLMDKVILLSPQNPHSYDAPKRILAIRRDAARLRSILGRLEATTLDLADSAKMAREDFMGVHDEKTRQASKSSMARLETILPTARAKGGATFAVVVSHLLAYQTATANAGGTANRNTMVTLAEEAYKASPSLASRWQLIQALLFRGTDRLAGAYPELASLRDRFGRSVSAFELVGAALSSGGSLKDPTLKDADVGRAIDLIRDSFAASPSYSADPLSWALLRASYPDIAASLARAYLENESSRLDDQIARKLRPYDPTPALKAYWLAQMQGREDEASKVLAEARSQGIPIPIDRP